MPIFLPEQGHFGPGSRDFLPVNEDLSPGRRVKQVQATQESAFSGAGRPDDRDHLALFYVYVHIGQDCQVSEFF